MILNPICPRFSELYKGFRAFLPTGQMVLKTLTVLPSISIRPILCLLYNNLYISVLSGLYREKAARVKDRSGTDAKLLSVPFGYLSHNNN
jgi:hypothetical protein